MGLLTDLLGDGNGVTSHEHDADYVNVTGGDTITASAAGVVPLVVKGAASQSANLLEARDSAEGLLATVGPDGEGFVRSLGVRSARIAGSDMSVTSGAAANRALVVRGVASQTGNLLTFQDSAGTELLSVAPNGRFNYPSALSTTVVGAAGAASPLPSAPTGYLFINVAGTGHRIPYYA